MKFARYELRFNERRRVRGFTSCVVDRVERLDIERQDMYLNRDGGGTVLTWYW